VGFAAAPAGASAATIVSAGRLDPAVAIARAAVVVGVVIPAVVLGDAVVVMVVSRHRGGHRRAGDDPKDGEGRCDSGLRC
jgi:hypothetical protein